MFLFTQASNLGDFMYATGGIYSSKRKELISQTTNRKKKKKKRESSNKLNGSSWIRRTISHICRWAIYFCHTQWRKFASFSFLFSLLLSLYESDSSTHFNFFDFVRSELISERKVGIRCVVCEDWRRPEKFPVTRWNINKLSQQRRWTWSAY